MSGQVTRFLTEWRAGDPQVVERLVPLLYDELRALARRQLRRESSAHTLSATALVHEVYQAQAARRAIGAGRGVPHLRGADPRRDSPGARPVDPVRAAELDDRARLAAEGAR